MCACRKSYTLYVFLCTALNGSQDGAALKKKFDDIFESTRYSKALDDVRKKRKSLMEDVKVQRCPALFLPARCFSSLRMLEGPSLVESVVVMFVPGLQSRAGRSEGTPRDVASDQGRNCRERGPYLRDSSFRLLGREFVADYAEWLHGLSLLGYTGSTANTG